VLPEHRTAEERKVEPVNRPTEERKVFPEPIKSEVPKSDIKATVDSIGRTSDPIEDGEDDQKTKRTNDNLKNIRS